MIIKRLSAFEHKSATLANLLASNTDVDICCEVTTAKKFLIGNILRAQSKKLAFKDGHPLPEVAGDDLKLYLVYFQWGILKAEDLYYEPSEYCSLPIRSTFVNLNLYVARKN